ncbi:hypothetical protein [Insulibacter thermoxylanivorax]|nr:hypothetical protein [Insulibacter thermoxylanivorax]
MHQHRQAEGEAHADSACDQAPINAAAETPLPDRGKRCAQVN